MLNLNVIDFNDIEDKDVYLDVIEENFNNLDGAFYTYSYLDKERILYRDGNYGIIFCKDGSYLDYSIFCLADDYSFEYMEFDGFNASNKNDRVMTWNANSGIYETINIHKRENGLDTEGYDSSIVYIQIDSNTNEQVIICYQYNDRGINNRIYSLNVQNPYSISFFKDSKLDSYVILKTEFGMLSYDIMALKEFGLMDFLKKGSYQLYKEDKISKFYKVKFTLSDGNPIILYPFSRAYNIEELMDKISRKGFKVEVPDYLIDFYNGDYEECKEYKLLAESLKKLDDNLSLNLDRK